MSEKNVPDNKKYVTLEMFEQYHRAYLCIP